MRRKTCHGWVWMPRTKNWKYVGEGDTMSEVSRLLDRDAPGKPNTHYAITGGAPPSWMPRSDRASIARE